MSLINMNLVRDFVPPTNPLFNIGIDDSIFPGKGMQWNGKEYEPISFGGGGTGGNADGSQITNKPTGTNNNNGVDGSHILNKPTIPSINDAGKINQADVRQTLGGEFFMNTGSHGFGIGDYMNNFGIKYRQGVITLSALDTIYVNNGGISSAITIDFSSMQRGTIANLALPTNDYDAANKKYVDDKVGSGSGTPTGNFLDLDSQNRQYFYESFDVFVPDVFRVVGDNYDGTGTGNSYIGFDYAGLYLHGRQDSNRNAAFQYISPGYNIDFGPGAINVNGGNTIENNGIPQMYFNNMLQLKGVVDPTDNQDVATKKYVDSTSSQGINYLQADNNVNGGSGQQYLVPSNGGIHIQATDAGGGRIEIDDSVLYFTISQERFPFSYDGTVSHPVDITRMYPVRKDSLLSIIVEANGPIQVNFIPND